jgi:hypothetical protein
VQAEGHARVPALHRTADGYRLGKWVSSKRATQDRLSAARRERLGDVEGWEWDPLAAAWESGFAKLTTYVQAEGHARVPQLHRTAEGYKLGTWVARQRSTQDRLSAAQRERLEAVEGWEWDPRAAAWEAGFAALTTYVQAEGHARVPALHRTAGGYPLGTWVSKQRTTQDRLSAARRERLIGLKGWVWKAV